MKQFLEDFKNYPFWLRWFLPLSALLFAAVLVTQMVLFPDNPIYLKNGIYVGKYGAVHSQEDFELFTWLNRVILVSGLSFFGFFICTLFYGKVDKDEKGKVADN